MKVAIYCRVSTLEQSKEGHSIEEQIKRLNTFCEVQDWLVYKEYIDAGFSGGNTNRPGLNELMNDLDKIDLVLVYKLDRLTRSVRDLMNLLDILEEKNVSFRSATEVFDTTSAFGKLFITLVGAMAEWERTTIAERTKMGRNAATQKGIYTTSPPFYYDKIDGKLYPNDKQEIVNYIIEQAKSGLSIRSITEQLTLSKYNPPKGKKWDKTTVTYVLMHPVTRGHTQIGEVFVENTHEPLLSEDDYQLILSKMKDRTRTKKREHTSIFRNKLNCHNCNRKLFLNTWTRTKKDGSKHFNANYICEDCKKNKSVKTFSIQKEKVENAFLYYMKNLNIGEYIIQQNSPKENKEEVIDINKVMKQREKYQIAFSLDLITFEEFEKRMKETNLILEKQKEIVVQKKHEIDSDRILKMRDFITIGWSELNEQSKEELIRSTVKSISYQFIEGSGYGKNRIPNDIKITDIQFYL